MTRIFWRSKEGSPAPPGARFGMHSFAGNRRFFSRATLLSSLPSPIPVLKPLQRIDEPNRREWRTMVKRVLGQIEQGLLQKVVLARKTTFCFSETPDPFRITAALVEKSEGASLFCIENKKTAFLGASPERLFRRIGQHLFVDVLAGTCQKGQAFSDKERLEFQFVKDHIHLSDLCQTITFSPMTTHRTANVQHIYTQAVGLLKPRTSDGQIIRMLHPTPAICGVPKNKAFDWIEHSEPFQRGLYGSLLWWSREEDADSTVCIRCCQVEEGAIHFYTGAGIVSGSDPDAEWEELEMKLALYEGIIECGRT